MSFEPLRGHVQLIGAGLQITGGDGRCPNELPVEKDLRAGNVTDDPQAARFCDGRLGAGAASAAFGVAARFVAVRAGSRTGLVEGIAVVAVVLDGRSAATSLRTGSDESFVSRNK